ncbi:hypothetical protein CDCA_CDCA12G3337 [Cyanidium caldarium]|uniref:Glycosyltransferase 2-like domain-containing protein n=1 Tax=Cyanidium caldarium TaxID=2771 RepID=A0AAV9IYE7_CYACA|nr:hypothetical protein CDCA_CDCA12G3337 [Cyanidium caldarium]
MEGWETTAAHTIKRRECKRRVGFVAPGALAGNVSARAGAAGHRSSLREVRPPSALRLSRRPQQRVSHQLSMLAPPPSPDAQLGLRRGGVQLGATPAANTGSPDADGCVLSVVIPLFNERQVLPKLLESLEAALESEMTPARYRESYQVVLVDDGSHDGTTEALRSWLTRMNGRTDRRDAGAAAESLPGARLACVTGIFFRRNYGQTPALAAGIQAARGELVVTMDGDLQQEPKDMFLLLEKLEREELDVVSGWRQRRRDDALRTFLSRVANALIRAATGVTQVTDLGCSLKAYRGAVLRDVRLYGEMHRFLPVLAVIEGARIDQLPVQHRARQYGRSKYGLARTFRVFCDLILLHYLTRYATRPMHWFGALALGIGALAALTLVLPTRLWTCLMLAGCSSARAATQRAAGTAAVLRVCQTATAIALAAAAVLLFALGVSAEVAMRAWHEGSRGADGGRPIYRIRDTLTYDVRAQRSRDTPSFGFPF